MRSGCWGACEGQALALRGPGDAFFFGACEGQALALRGAARVFFGALRGTGPRTTVRTECLSPHRSAGACPPRSLPHPGHPVNPVHPASDVGEIKVLTDLFSVLCLRSIDIQVFQTFFSLIL